MIKNNYLWNVVFSSFEFFDRKSVKARDLRFTKVRDADHRLVKDSVTKGQGIALWEMRNRGASRPEKVFLGF